MTPRQRPTDRTQAELKTGATFDTDRDRDTQSTQRPLVAFTDPGREVRPASAKARRPVLAILSGPLPVQGADGTTGNEAKG